MVWHVGLKNSVNPECHKRRGEKMARRDRRQTEHHKKKELWVEEPHM